MTMTEEWTKEWERRIVNGVYPLRRFLGRSNHSVVFLTECNAQGVAQAAIKILPAHAALTEARLSRWRTAATLSHPHLMRLLDAGRCELGGHQFLFVVMDHADQNLAQVLRGRALTAPEVRDTLPAALDALAYLHGQNLVQGALKPSNFLVVNDQLKLASDTIRPAGERPAGFAKLSSYDPPEAKSGRVSTASDIWGFGITLVEALTQAAPVWSREVSDPVVAPAGLAPEFMATVQRCLNRDPGQRPGIAELAAQFTLVLPPPLQPPPPPPPLPPPPPPAAPAPTVAPGSAAPSAAGQRAVPTNPQQESPGPRLPVTAMALVVGVLCAVWAGSHLFQTHSTVRQPAPIAPQSPPSVSPPVPVPGVGADK